MRVDVLWLIPAFTLGVAAGLAYAIWKIEGALREWRRT